MGKKMKPATRKYSWDFDDKKHAGPRASGRFMKKQVHKAERANGKKECSDAA